MDFIMPERRVPLRLVAGEGHYETVIGSVLAAQCSVWIATANLKDLMVRNDRTTLRRARGAPSHRSILEAFAELADQSIELRILHATMPSRFFRRTFDKHRRLASGGLELRLCPRVHMKTVIVDGQLLYLGSANWTGAGLGVKQAGRRNFELGILTEDAGLLDQVQAMYEAIWTGKECPACKLREVCGAPLDR
jgi:phosphatidylserine/phosphatidylglycerophosphate/cardiolipin synthase-like enzyme